MSDVCDAEDVDRSGASGESGGGFVKTINQTGLNGNNRREGHVPRSIREGDVETEEGVDAEVGYGRVTDIKGVECWVSDWSRSGGS